MQLLTTARFSRRNLTLYFRDRWTVLFSLMGALVLLVLYMLFLGNLTSSGLEEGFPAVSPSVIRGFIDSWMFSGVILISTVTTGVAALTALVDDRVSGRFKDFLVAPVSRSVLTAGYLLSAVAVSVIVSGILIAIGFLYLGLTGAGWLPFARVLKIVLITLLCCFSFGALSAYAATFMNSASANSAFNATVGTLLGFVAAAYIPIGVLPKGVASAINVLPFSQAGMLLRQQFTGPALQELTAGVPMAREALEAEFGMSLQIGSWSVPAWFAITYLVVLGLAFTLMAASRIRRRLG